QIVGTLAGKVHALGLVELALFHPVASSSRRSKRLADSFVFFQDIDRLLATGDFTPFPLGDGLWELAPLFVRLGDILSRADVVFVEDERLSELRDGLLI